MSACTLLHHLPQIISRVAITAVCVTASITATAETPDTLSVAPSSLPDSIPAFMRPATSHDRPFSATDLHQSTTLLSSLSDFSYRPQPQLLEPYHFSFPENPILAAWRGGAVTASGSSTSMPGLMGIESGRITINQSLGPLTISAWAGADKFGYFRGLQTAYGFGGQIDYMINDRWSVTAFGHYYTPIHPLTPAMAGYMSTSGFGGYASYNINDHWGISVGAQATRSLVTNRWEAQPIVTPYYRVNKKVSIGIDVGGIIYNLAKDYLESHNDNNRNYSGPPAPMGGNVPRPSPGRVAPRR